MNFISNLFTSKVKRLKSKKDVDTLILLLSPENSQGIRIKAALALGEIGGQKAISALMSNLSDKNPNIRIAALEALGETGDKIAVDSIIPFFKDKNFKVRQSAILSLQRINDDSALAPLLELLDDSDSQTLSVVRDTLKLWTPNKEITEALTNTATITKQNQRAMAIDWWKEIGSKNIKCDISNISIVSNDGYLLQTCKCDICNISIVSNDGYLLQTSEILQSNKYIDYATSLMPKNRNVPGLDSFFKEALEPAMDLTAKFKAIDNIKNVTTPWLICNKCLDKYFTQM